MKKIIALCKIIKCKILLFVHIFLAFALLVLILLSCLCPVRIKLYDKLGSADFPKTGISNVTPGDFYDKEVWVKSCGCKQIYVRALIETKWVSSTGAVLPMQNGSQDTVIVNIGSDWLAGPANENPPTGGQWYYYKYILDKHETTAKLIDGVTFSSTAINGPYLNATFSITIRAEGVQAAHEAFLCKWHIQGAAGNIYKVPVAGVEEWAPCWGIIPIFIHHICYFILAIIVLIIIAAVVWFCCICKCKKRKKHHV